MLLVWLDGAKTLEEGLKFVLEQRFRHFFEYLPMQSWYEKNRGKSDNRAGYLGYLEDVG